LKTITCRVLFDDSISAFHLLIKLVGNAQISNFRVPISQSVCDSSHKYAGSYKSRGGRRLRRVVDNILACVAGRPEFAPVCLVLHSRGDGIC